MATVLGAHVTQGSRDGYGLVAPHCRGVVSLVGGAFDEVHEDTYRVYRPVNVYGEGHTDIMPGFNDLTVGDMGEQAAYWWPKIRAQTEREQGFHGRIDAIQATNEVGGNDVGEIAKLIAYEKVLVTLAAADGWTLLIGNFATNSPHWEIWVEHVAPFIRWAWERGHIYSRHAYFDAHPPADNQERPFKELGYLGNGGPVILTEVGFVNFPGPDAFMDAIKTYDERIQQYPNVGFGAIFTYGDWQGPSNNANIEDASSRLAAYLETNPFQKWTPTHQESPPEEPPMATQEVKSTSYPRTQMAGLGGHNVERVSLRWLVNRNGENVYLPWSDLTLPANTDLRGVEVRATATRTHVVECPEPPADEPTDAPEPPPTTTPQIAHGSLGVDVSAHQGVYDWAAAMRNGLKFAIIRCSNGSIYDHTNTGTHDADGIDLQLWRNAEELTRLGIPWSVYHFLQPDPDRINPQIVKVQNILSELVKRGTPPRGATFADGSTFPAVWCDVEDVALPSHWIKAFVDKLQAGVYTRANIWEPIHKNVGAWWADTPLWIAEYGANDGTIPDDGPTIPRGFEACHIWQFTSVGGRILGWGKPSLDVNVAGPFVGDEPPPTGGQVIDLQRFLQADPLAWRVVRHPDGQQEDVRDMALGDGKWVVYVGGNGRWYQWMGPLVWQIADTSPGKDSQGNARMYVVFKDGVAGAPIAMLQQRVGETWIEDGEHTVQFYAESDCRELPENSGKAQNTAVIERYEAPHTFDTYGQNLTVDEAIWIRTGGDEVQVYARKDGKCIGWCGWTAPWGQSELVELHWNRGELQREPDRVCDWE